MVMETVVMESGRFYEHKPPVGWTPSKILPPHVGRCKLTGHHCSAFTSDVDCRNCNVPERVRSGIITVHAKDVEAVKALDREYENAQAKAIKREKAKAKVDAVPEQKRLPTDGKGALAVDEED